MDMDFLRDGVELIDVYDSDDPYVTHWWDRCDKVPSILQRGGGTHPNWCRTAPCAFLAPRIPCASSPPGSASILCLMLLFCF